MIFPLVLLIPVIASVVLYRLLRGMDAAGNYWLVAARIAGAVAAARIGASAAGVYLLESTSGWLQLPAYLMVLCSLPELYLVPKPSWGSAGSLARLSALIVLGSAVWVFSLAGFAARHRSSRSSHSSGL